MSTAKDQWERFAREDPEFYIASNRREWTTEDFYASGRPILDYGLSFAGRLDRGLAVEIGCGLGRLTVHLAHEFERVIATDISEVMIQRAEERDLPHNITWKAVSDGHVPVAENAADLVYSYNVMQHIPDSEVISGYLREIRRMLDPLGRAIIQFDTSLRPRWKRVAHRLPDPLLPRTQRRYIRRYPLAVTGLETMVRKAALETVAERGVGSHEHYVVLSHQQV